VLLGDPAKIRQVLINLIANAIKFTHKGGILLNCSVINRTSETLTIRFDISDSGIGIRLANLNASLSLSIRLTIPQGAVILVPAWALPSAKILVKSMGGEITVKSSPRNRFNLFVHTDFKKARTQLPEYNPDKPLQPPTLPEKVRILFTDDDSCKPYARKGDPEANTKPDVFLQAQARRQFKSLSRGGLISFCLI
jgi:hypothetical protein